METTQNHIRKGTSEKLSGSPVSRADHHTTFVKWSDEDGCWIGYCPDLFIGGVCHGETRLEVAARLSILVEDDVRSRIEKGENLPQPAFNLAETST
jgi:predicted RNase H-like HicB family nuclease